MCEQVRVMRSAGARQDLDRHIRVTRAGPGEEEAGLGPQVRIYCYICIEYLQCLARCG